MLCEIKLVLSEWWYNHPTYTVYVDQGVTVATVFPVQMHHSNSKLYTNTSHHQVQCVCYILVRGSRACPGNILGVRWEQYPGSLSHTHSFSICFGVLSTLWRRFYSTKTNLVDKFESAVFTPQCELWKLWPIQHPFRIHPRSLLQPSIPVLLTVTTPVHLTVGQFKKTHCIHCSVDDRHLGKDWKR